ncbi:NUDIX hydrolase [Actinoplanes bogorensis]|uniref:NUDIX hydrolase n=1 Tax=Paractinoplanes bogorensis TaxID=1610840 RepID=A0ABS5YQE2_9ACTN|nr:NUDIX hydrolase [Actinoplanes bogorensis]MBU2664230.1 NUDIX hydrolase [Actinoplanes bogorensis]
MDDESRRSLYRDMRDGRPELFVNPEGAPIEILFEPDDVAAAEAATAAMLAEYGLPAEWGQTGVVFMDHVITVLRDAVRMPNGLGTYDRAVNAGNAAGVVVLPRYREQVVLIRHFRHSTREWHLEVPRGFGTPGNDDAECDARREVQEEIGVAAAELEDLGVMYPDTGASGTPVRLFYAELDEEPVTVDEAEGITGIVLVPVAELTVMIADGTLTDGFTIAAFARAQFRGLLSDEAVRRRRERRLDRYDELRAERPRLFVNPADAAYEILFDRAAQLACARDAAGAARESEFADMGVVYEDRFFIALRDTVRFRDGAVRPYFRLIGAVDSPGAAVLPMLSDGRLVLVRRFRHEARDWRWEVPRGFPEPGETGPVTAARELGEELGVNDPHLERLGVYGEDEIYLARFDADRLPERLTDGAVEEGVDEVRVVTADELAGLIVEGRITDEFLLAAYAMLQARRSRNS